jgi:hypothetical protein
MSSNRADREVPPSAGARQRSVAGGCCTTKKSLPRPGGWSRWRESGAGCGWWRAAAGAALSGGIFSRVGTPWLPGISGHYGWEMCTKPGEVSWPSAGSGRLPRPAEVEDFPARTWVMRHPPATEHQSGDHTSNTCTVSTTTITTGPGSSCPFYRFLVSSMRRLGLDCLSRY